MENKTFSDGKLSTKFIEEEFTPEIRDTLHQSYIEKNQDAMLSLQAYLDTKRERKLFVEIK
jgi:hypothetical protein